MRRGRLQPLVWPIAVLIASGLTGLAAEATARSVQTVPLYGLIKMTSDLLLLNEQIPFVQIGIDKKRPDSSAILVAESVLGALMPTRQRAVARHESAASAR